ncbi:hypothetical protein A9Q84_09035 [Halobacteriovorax marinus]|uniref:Radical SAM core domain-containing protein n=1 Tax=Halobacteriovorax marinus TaxID=97084 RepID=A0A1Y5F6F9_9BACT|nr:hypothetical protein A9Q84_09035 [Halobacteriovorax marinus]
MSTDFFSEITYLMIETNSTCNLKCTTCNREDLVASGLREDKYLSVSEFDERIKIFKDCKINTVKIEGISEPMLHPDFSKMCNILKGYFPDAFVIIATNCQYNVDKVPFVDSLKYVDQVYLSIDGVEDIYEETRLGAKWDKLLKFLNRIKDLVEEKERKEKLFINFTLTEKNYHTLPAIYQLSEDYGLAGVRINLAQNWNEDEMNSHQFSKEVIETLKQYTDDLKGIPNWNYKDCFWPYAGVVIDVYGYIRQCIINTSQEPIFNVENAGFKDFFNNSEHYKRIRKSLSNDKAQPECENCDYKHLSPVLEEIFNGRECQNTPRKFNKGEVTS